MYRKIDLSNGELNIELAQSEGRSKTTYRLQAKDIGTIRNVRDIESRMKTDVGEIEEASHILYVQRDPAGGMEVILRDKNLPPPEADEWASAVRIREAAERGR